MKLQLSILTLIIVLLAYIYFSRCNDDARTTMPQLLGFGSFARAKLSSAKVLWRKIHGKTNYPTDSVILKWATNVRRWQKVYGSTRYPARKLDLEEWYKNHLEKEKAKEESMKKRAAALAKAKRDKAAREAAAKRAKDPCEWLKMKNR